MMSIPDRLKNNLPLKLLSLIIALVIWGVVHNQANPLVSRQRAVRVEVLDVPPNLAVASVDPEQITVKLSGRTSAFDQLETSGFRLTAAVTLNEVGTQTAMVQAEGVPSGLEISDMSHKIVHIRLDTVVTARRPVFVQTRGEPASGFAATGSEVKPNEVTVTGPSSQVQRVARVVAEVDISGRNSAQPTSVGLEAQDSASLAIAGVRLEPSEATVTVQLRQVNSRTVPVVPVIEGVPSGYEISTISVKPATVTVTGTSATLGGVDAVQTSAVGLSGNRNGGTFNVSLRLPTGTGTVGSASAVVTIRLREATAGEPSAAQSSPTPESAPSAEPATGPAPSKPAEIPAPPPAPGPPNTGSHEGNPARGQPSPATESGHGTHNRPAPTEPPKPPPAQ